MKFRNAVNGYVAGLGLAIGISLGVSSPANAATFGFTAGAIDDATTTTYTTTVIGLVANTTDVNLLLNLTHDSLFDLEIYLTAPTGQILNLASALSNFTVPGTVDATLDDAGALPIDVGFEPYTGTFQPSGYTTPPFATALAPTLATFSGFNGLDPNGTWTLSIADVSPGNTGTLISSTLDVTAAAVPFEFSPAVGLLALGALYGSDLLRRKILSRKIASK